MVGGDGSKGLRFKVQLARSTHSTGAAAAPAARAGRTHRGDDLLPGADGLGKVCQHRICAVKVEVVGEVLDAAVDGAELRG